MNETRLCALEQLRAFLEGTGEVRFQSGGDDEGATRASRRVRKCSAQTCYASCDCLFGKLLYASASYVKSSLCWLRHALNFLSLAEENQGRNASDSVR